MPAEIFEVVSDCSSDHEMPEEPMREGRVIIQPAATEGSLRTGASEVELGPKEDSQVILPKGSCGNGEFPGVPLQEQQHDELVELSESEGEVPPTEPDLPALAFPMLEAPRCPTWPGRAVEIPANERSFRRANTSQDSLQASNAAPAPSLAFSPEASEGPARGSSTISLEEKMGAINLGDDDEVKVGSMQSCHACTYICMCTCISIYIHNRWHTCFAPLAGQSAISGEE